MEQTQNDAGLFANRLEALRATRYLVRPSPAKPSIADKVIDGETEAMSEARECCGLLLFSVPHSPEVGEP